MFLKDVYVTNSSTRNIFTGQRLLFLLSSPLHVSSSHLSPSNTHNQLQSSQVNVLMSVNRKVLELRREEGN